MQQTATLPDSEILEAIRFLDHGTLAALRREDLGMPAEIVSLDALRDCWLAHAERTLPREGYYSWPDAWWTYAASLFPAASDRKEVLPCDSPPR